MNPGNVLCIIQARMGSTRLPGKVLIEIAGMSMLSRVIERLRLSHTIGQFVVATTVTRADEAVVRECRRLGVDFFRGSEEDVLDRFYQADAARTANGAGLNVTCTVQSEEELASGARMLRQSNGTAFVVLRVRPDSPPAFAIIS